jgi:hypothetical protein
MVNPLIGQINNKGSTKKYRVSDIWNIVQHCSTMFNIVQQNNHKLFNL